MKTMPHVYVAGPYSSPYPIYNMRHALEAANALIDTGVALPVVPHAAFPRPYEDYWPRLDLGSMRGCDCVWRIPGASSGADAEVAEAITMGLPVFHTLDEVVAFARTWAVDR